MTVHLADKRGPICHEVQPGDETTRSLIEVTCDACRLGAARLLKAIFNPAHDDGSS